MRYILGYVSIIIGHLLVAMPSINKATFISTEANFYFYFIGSLLVFLGIFLVQKRLFSNVFFWSMSILCTFIYVLMPPSLSDDVYRYMWDGQVSLQGDSPYKYLPQEKKNLNKQLYPLLNSQKYYSVYPPTSQTFFYLSAVIAQKNIYLQLFIFKIFCAISFILTIFIILKILKHMQHKENIIYLVAWNPFFLSELVGQAHSEVFMILFLICTLYFYNKNISLSFFFLSLATLTKLYPLLLFPFFLIEKKNWKYLWIPIVTAISFCLPFYCENMLSNIQSSLKLYTNFFSFNSIIFTLLDQLVIQLHLPNSGQAALKYCWLIFIIFYFFILAGSIFYRKYFQINQKYYMYIFLYILFGYVFFNATIHPWYITPLLFIIIFFPNLHKIIVIWPIIIAPTYLFYSSMQNWQKTYILIEYIILIAILVPWILQKLMQFLALRKFIICKNYLQGKTLLDIGCGEGYLGEFCHKNQGMKAHNLDVIPLNKSNLPYTMYDGKKIPFPDNSFDTVICCLMLHHCEEPLTVLKEAIRVSKNRIIIFESTFETKLDLQILTFIDRTVNFIRSYGKMGKEELHFFSPKEWEKIFVAHKISTHKTFWANRFIHKHIVYILNVNERCFEK